MERAVGAELGRNGRSANVGDPATRRVSRERQREMRTYVSVVVSSLPLAECDTVVTVVVEVGFLHHTHRLSSASLSTSSANGRYLPTQRTRRVLDSLSLS